MNMVNLKRAVNRSVILLSLIGTGLALTACGGGDSKKSTASSSSSSSSSTHSFIPTPITPSGDGNWPNVKVSANGTKTLKFEWTAVPGSTSYKLLKKTDSNSPYMQVGTDFASTVVTDSVNVHLTDWVNSRYKVQACNGSNCQDSAEIVTNSAMLNAISYIKASNAEASDWFGWSIAVSADGKTLAVGAPSESSKAIGVNGDQNNNESATSGAVYVFTKVNGNWIQEAYLKASNTEQPNTNNPAMVNPKDRFGYKVALSADGNTLAVSAINEDSMSLHINCDQNDIVDTYYTSSSSVSSRYKRQTDTGAVYVFTRSNTTWAQTAYIKPSIYTGTNLNADLNFGLTLAISGDGKTLAVGTQSDGMNLSGAYTIGNPNSSASSTSSCINFSSSSNSSSIVSSSSSSSSSNSSTTTSSSSTSNASSSIPGGAGSGAVFTYVFKNNEWQEEAYIKASDAGVGDAFGGSIALSQDGNTLAVGAAGEDSLDQTASNATYSSAGITGGAMDVGAVYLFKRTENGWGQTAKLKPSTPQWQHLFGYSLAISADGAQLAVGAPGDWSKHKGTQGIDSNFTYETLTVPVQSDFGTYYTLAPLYSVTGEKSAFGSGACYIFSISNGTWVQTGYLKASNSRSALQFGETVSISADGKRIAVGSFTEPSQATGINGDQEDQGALLSGAAYFFAKTESGWIQKSYVKAPNAEKQDRFARAIGLDLSGDNLFIGAYREASKATGVNGNRSDNSADASGAVYVY